MNKSKYYKKKGKYKVKLYRLNWDAECLYDIMNNRGFLITEPPTFTNDDSKYKSLYGPRSPLYGTTAEDPDAFAERHRCMCGLLKGRMNDGAICEFCHSKVEYRELDIKYTGYISFGTFLINPYYYYRMQEVFGKQALTEIVIEKREVDIDGNVFHITDFEKFNIKPKTPFYGIGIEEFKERFDEVLDWFKSKKSAKAREIERLRDEKTNVFCSVFPVYSTALRPQSITSDTFYYTPIDSIINTLFSLSELVKRGTPLEKSNNIIKMQDKLNKLWESNFALLDGKEGLNRGQVAGGSVNYSARHVVIPGSDLRDDEVDIPYISALKLMESRILYYLTESNKTNGSDKMPYFEAEMILKRAYSKFDNRIYEIIKFILKKEKPRLIINRNPTLNIYSIVLVKIRKVKDDIDDLTLSIPPSILNGMNADFDGDVLNILYIPLPEIQYMLRNFNPVKKYIVSRDSGLINTNIMLEKSYMIDFIAFNTI